MAEKIGKYEVIGRIGRGGMGMIFKARDPVLERSVALKVISSLEVTPELRARFFREAQACARLSHPNIVTIYDMGEDDGRLFIVMELLEGEELRQLIARQPPLALEDKLSILLQICDGLHYAHQKGVVHRDVKPANILLLRTGQVKILDFGIAQIAATQGELTRTGLIMGTLRYMAPEQVRGRADHRSDIFSVGAVSYELLAARPPFSGEDPMQLLEQLRTETPPRLSEVDPGLPSELAAVVERAMQKEPGDRFADLGEMGLRLRPVQRALAEEAERVRARVDKLRDDLGALQRTVAEQMGGTPRDDSVPPPPIGESARLAALQALEREIAERIQAAQAQLARLGALAPVVQRGLELIEAGQFADAVLELEAVVAEVPKHARALDGLVEARAKAEESRRRQLAGVLVADARTALLESSPSLCLEILKQAAEISPALLGAEIAALRERAEAALAAEEAARQAREQAEGARAQMARARRIAEGQATAYAPALWNEAEARAAEAHMAFGRAAYADAAARFAAASAAYQRFEEAAREARQREREATERARYEATEGRERARVAAPARARELWEAAEAKAAAGEEARAVQAFDRARGLFIDAAALYRGAEAAAAEVRDHEPASAQDERPSQRLLAEQARQTVAECRRLALIVDAATNAPAEWSEAEAVLASGNMALSDATYPEAVRQLEAAAALYRRAEAGARGVLQAVALPRSEVEKARETAALARRAAAVARAATYASEEWSAGESAEAQASAALSRQEHALARSLFADARRRYTAAAQAANVTEEAEARRADAMMTDARRLLAAGDVAGCQRRLHQVLALRPDHADATALRVEVEARLGPAKAARDGGAPRQAGDRGDATASDLLDETIVQTPTLSGVPGTPAEAPTELIEPAPMVVLADPPGPVAVPAPVTSAPAADIDRAQSGDTRRRSGDATARETRGARVRRTRAIAIGAGTLAAVVIATLYWRPSTTPPGSPADKRAPAASSADAMRVDAVEELRRRLALIREEAARTGAEKVAPRQFAAAVKKAEEGDLARGQKDMATAQQRYREAIDAFGLATGAAESPALPPRAESEPPRVASRAAEGRRDAEAPKAAASTSASSTTRPDRAVLTPRDPDKAGRASAGPSGTRKDAEQARVAMAASKRAAEQVAAGFFAHQRFASAQSKEREGMAALGQTDYATASRLLGEAQSEYQMAAREARREEETNRRLAPLKATLDQAHAAAAAHRQQALAVEADRLAKEIFEHAQARQVEADGLAERQDLATAAQAYQDAAERYGEAARRAQAARAAK